MNTGNVWERHGINLE